MLGISPTAMVTIPPPRSHLLATGPGLKRAVYRPPWASRTGVGAQLLEVAVGHDPHPVGPLGGGEPVGDHDHRAPLHQRGSRACSTSTSVPGSSDEVGLVEHQHGSGSASAARASDTSCFSPADKPRAPLLHLACRGPRAARRSAPGRRRRRAPASTAASEAPRPGRPARCRGSSRRTGTPPGARRTTSLPQRRIAASAQVDPADADDAGYGRVVEPGHELGQRSTCRRRWAPPAPAARRRGTPQRRRAARARRRRSANDTPSTSSIGAAAPAGRRRRGRLGHLDRLGVEQVEELVSAGAGRLHDVEQLAQLVERLEQVRQGAARRT